MKRVQGRDVGVEVGDKNSEEIMTLGTGKGIHKISVCQDILVIKQKWSNAQGHIRLLAHHIEGERREERGSYCVKS